jgi:hypothetical protein
MQPVNMRANSTHIGYVQRRVAKGDYRVDPARVAEAMLQRIGAIVLDREISDRDDRAHAQAGTHRQAA